MKWKSFDKTESQSLPPDSGVAWEKWWNDEQNNPLIVSFDYMKEHRFFRSNYRFRPKADHLSILKHFSLTTTLKYYNLFLPPVAIRFVPVFGVVIFVVLFCQNKKPLWFPFFYFSFWILWKPHCFVFAFDSQNISSLDFTSTWLFVVSYFFEIMHGYILSLAYKKLY